MYALPAPYYIRRPSPWERFIRWAAGRFNYANKVDADSWYGAVAKTSPGTIFFGLSTAAWDRTKTGATITEASYTGYARVGVTNNTTNFPAGSSGASGYTIGGNLNAITFAQNSGASQTMNSAFTCDSTTLGAGNLIHGADVSATAIGTSDTPQIPASGFSDVES